MYYYLKLPIKANKRTRGHVPRAFYLWRVLCCRLYRSPVSRPPGAQRGHYISFHAILYRYSVIACRSEALTGFLSGFCALVVYIPYKNRKRPYGACTGLFSLYAAGATGPPGDGTRTDPPPGAGAAGTRHDWRRGIVAIVASPRHSRHSRQSRKVAGKSIVAIVASR